MRRHHFYRHPMKGQGTCTVERPDGYPCGEEDYDWAAHLFRAVLRPRLVGSRLELRLPKEGADSIELKASFGRRFVTLELGADELRQLEQAAGDARLALKLETLPPEAEA